MPDNTPASGGDRPQNLPRKPEQKPIPERPQGHQDIETILQHSLNTNDVTHRGIDGKKGSSL